MELRIHHLKGSIEIIPCIARASALNNVISISITSLQYNYVLESEYLLVGNKLFLALLHIPSSLSAISCISQDSRLIILVQGHYNARLNITPCRVHFHKLLGQNAGLNSWLTNKICLT